MKEYGSWVCGPWKREETELICCKFSKCTKDYFQFSSAISLLSVRQLQHVDTPPTCHLDIRRFFSPQKWLIGGIVCSKVS